MAEARNGHRRPTRTAGSGLWGVGRDGVHRHPHGRGGQEEDGGSVCPACSQGSDPRPGLQPLSPGNRCAHLPLPGNRCAHLLPVLQEAKNPKGHWEATSAQTDWLRSLPHPFLSFAFFLFSFFWRLRRSRPGCAQAHAVGFRTRDPEGPEVRGGNGVHGPGTLLLCRVAEGGTSGHRACPEQPRGRERWRQTAGQAPPEPGLRAPRAGTPTPSWGRQRHPQEGCLRPPRAAPPRPQGTVQAERARSSSVCNISHGSSKSFQGEGERLGTSPVLGGRCSGR